MRYVKRRYKVLVTIISLFACSVVNARIVSYDFSGIGGQEVINGYFSLDTEANPDSIVPPTTSYGVSSNSDSLLVDFGITIQSGNAEISFNAQKSISNQDPWVGVFGQVTNNQLSGVDGQGNAVFSDLFRFRVSDQGIAATPSEPLFSTIKTNDITNYLFFADLFIGGGAELLNSATVPESIEYSNATNGTLFIQIGSAVFDPNLDRLVSVGSIDANYTITDISLSAVPVPAAVWLFSSGLIGIVCMSKKIKLGRLG